MIGSETGIETEYNENLNLDSQDYKSIYLVLVAILVVAIGLFSLVYFLAWGDLNETLEKITPPAVTATEKPALQKHI